MSDSEHDNDVSDEEEEELDDEDGSERRRPLSKAKAQENIDSQLADMIRARALQAERKLQFLLQQNDIFKHFGLDASKVDGSTRPKKDHGSRRMSENEGDSELMQADGDGGGTRLIKQPSIINGEMRAYQLEVRLVLIPSFKMERLTFSLSLLDLFMLSGLFLIQGPKLAHPQS